MSLVTTRGSHVTLRRGRKTARLVMADVALQGTEATMRDVTRRLEFSLSRDMSPASVSVHIRSLSPMKYDLLLSPEGSTPPRDWWRVLLGVSKQ